MKQEHHLPPSFANANLDKGAYRRAAFVLDPLPLYREVANGERRLDGETD